MTATYTNNPAGSSRDAVRLLVFDNNVTTEANAKLSDEEIQFFIGRNSHISLAAAEAAEAIGAKFASGGTSKKVGDLQIDGVGMSYKELADTLRSQAGRRAGSGAYAGGTSIADKDAQEADTDRIQTDITIGMDDNPQAGTSHDRGILEF